MTDLTFITGPRGSGKTIIANALCDTFRLGGDSVILGDESPYNKTTPVDKAFYINTMTVEKDDPQLISLRGLSMASQIILVNPSSSLISHLNTRFEIKNRRYITVNVN